MVVKKFYFTIDGKNVLVNIKSNSMSKNITVIYLETKIVIIKPTRMSNTALKRVLEDNKTKIVEEYIANLRKCSNKIGKLNTIFYDGKEYILKILKQDENRLNVTVRLDEKSLLIFVPIKNWDEKKSVAIYALDEFFRKNTKKMLKTELVNWSKVTNVSYNKVSVKRAKTKWGSCVKNTRKLNFNLKLSMMPQYVRSSIIVHELCHIIEANHSANFWKLVYSYIPNYDECKKWLKDNFEKLSYD